MRLTPITKKKRENVIKENNREWDMTTNDLLKKCLTQKNGSVPDTKG